MCGLSSKPIYFMATGAMLGSSFAPALAQASIVGQPTWPLSAWGAAFFALLALIACGFVIALRAKLRHLSRQMQESESRLNTILDSANACIYIKDAHLRYTYGNRELCKRFSLPLHELVGSSDSLHLPADVFTRIRATDLRVIELGERVVCEEEVPNKRTGNLDTYLSIKTPIRDAEGRITALCGVSTDITELRESQAAVHRLAYYDPLTELPNRRMLQEKIEEALLLHKRLGQVAGLVFIDLDKFKNINDERGHEVGDAVLRAIANRLLKVAGPHDTVGRLGGDEFVILLNDLGRETAPATELALVTAEKIRRTLEKAVQVGEHLYFTGGSIGVTLLDSETKTVTDALREADTAMYQSKERGRNRVALYEPSMQLHVAERARMLRDLAKALHHHQFRVLVQPQYDTEGDVVGAELLLRWQHPEHGVIKPGEFIRLAEESGVVIELGEWVITQACMLHARLVKQGCAHPVSVNVSPVQLKHPRFAQRLSEILERWNMAPSQLTLEVTEDVLIENIDDTATHMQEIAQTGLRFSIDDFGMGYSGLAYLHRLPLSELKIPKCFVEKLPEQGAATLIRLIVSTARLLDLRVIAEGVEHAPEAEFLIATGCDALQGYYHHRPMPLDEWVAIHSRSAKRGIEPHHEYEAQHEATGGP